MRYLAMVIRQYPLILLRRIGIKSCLSLIVAVCFLAFVYTVATVHTRVGMHRESPLDSSGPIDLDRLSGFMSNKVRRGHRLQQHQDKEQVICTVPMAEERFKQKQSQSVQKEAHPKERCSQKLFSYSYKSQGLVFNDHILDGVTLDRCEFVGIEWESDNSITYDDPITINTSPYIPTQLTRDFYEVKCFITPATGTEQMSDYEEYVAIITEDQTVSKRKQEAKRPSDKTQYNVLVISAEGLADEKFHPVFADVILKGYNSLGSDLPSSFIPLLTGLKVEDIPEVRRGKASATYVDALPFIWNRFENAGYVTLFAEDSIDHGIFHEQFTGFESPPTAHYMRPFWIASDDCVPSHQHTLQYVEAFLFKYTESPKMAFALLHAASLNDINNELFSMLTRLKTHAILDNTIVLLMSGHHFNTYKNYTVLEKLNNRMPFIALNFPEIFRSNNPQWLTNIWSNTERFTTPYDIYHTLNNLLTPSKPKKATRKRMNGQSLFDVVPGNRTCRSEGVPIEVCSCVHWVSQSATSLQDHGKSIANYINGLTGDIRSMCEQLVFDRVLDVKTLYRKEKIIKHTEGSESNLLANTSQLEVPPELASFQIIAELQPGNRVYEVVIENKQMQKDIVLLNKLKHEDSNCVMEKRPELQKYCHCKKIT